jgi:hypothetical protein
MDWGYLLVMALRHGIMPLLYYNLKANCTDAVPEDAMNRLRDHFHSNAKYNFFLTSELLKTLNLFESRGISVIPFKGPVLAMYAYGDIALRQFVDLDILVRKEEFSRASEILVSQGFKPQFELTGEQEATFIEFRCEHAFGSADAMTTVDLHWAVVPTRYSFAPDPESYWKRLERVSFGGTTISTISPEDLFLLLCVHGAKHSWKHLNWVCDLAELIREHEQIGWRNMIKQASTTGTERMLFLGIFLAHDLLDADIPHAVLQEAQSDPAIRPLAAQVYARLFRETDKRTWFFEEDLFYLRTMKRLRDKARLCFDHAVPTPLEWEIVQLPSSVSFIYYLLRPVRLAGKYGQRLMKRFFSSSDTTDDKKEC